MIAPAVVLAWVMLIGTVVMLPFAVGAGVPDALDASTLGWLTFVGAANLVGLLMVYNGLRIGKVGIVSPIASAEGAVAALVAVFAGERIAPGAALMLVLIAVGVVLASLSRDVDTLARQHHGMAAGLAAGAALSFGVGLYITGRLSDRLPVQWVLLPPRVLGVLVLTLPLAFAGRLRLPRRAAPLVATSGLCEILGNASYAFGARHGIAVTAVLASQFAAVAAVAAYFLFHERLGRVQLVGVVVVLVGVGVLTALQA
jgi:drug/metabolite transporter (DMT)-like permease